MSETLSALLECHGRIRRFVAGLQAIAAAPDWADRRVRAEAAGCARYFGLALPLHAADEDESLAPRLPAGARAALEAMAAEHARIEALLPALVAALGRVAAGEPASRGDYERLQGEFAELLLAHIAAEEAGVFPALEALSPADHAAIRAEMRARRQR